jgi:hypothetical protein
VLVDLKLLGCLSGDRIRHLEQYLLFLKYLRPRYIRSSLVRIREDGNTEPVELENTGPGVTFQGK